MDNKMSLLTSPYVPEGMVDLMKKLSKGVIKERPSNIYEYAAAFFEKMLIERDGSLNKGYGKFRSYTEYCKFMDIMDQRRLNQPIKTDDIATDHKTDEQPKEVAPPLNIQVQGVAIQGVERRSKDNVKNVSINPKYKNQSEKVMKPVVSNVKTVKAKPRKLSSKKPSENLIVIKEETSADVDDSGNGGPNMHRAAATIQRAFRMFLSKMNRQNEHGLEISRNVSRLSEDAAAYIIQKAFKSLIQKSKSLAQSNGKNVEESNNNVVVPVAGQKNDIHIDKIKNNDDVNSEQTRFVNNDEDTEQELDQKDKQLKDSSEDTAAASKMEVNPTHLPMNSDVVTTAFPETKIDSEDIQIEEFTPSDSVISNQAVIVSDNMKETGDNQNPVATQNNEASIPSDETALSTSININAEENQATLTDDTSDQNADNEIESVNNLITETGSEFIESNQNQVNSISAADNIICQSIAETEEVEQSTLEIDRPEVNAEPKQLEIVADDEEVEQLSHDSEQIQTKTTLNVSETKSNVDPTVADSGGKMDSQEIQDSLTQQEETSSQETKIQWLVENVSAENVLAAEVVPNQNHLKDNVEVESSTDVVDQNHLKENVEVESSTDVVDQNHLKDNVEVESSTDVVDQNHLKDNVEVESSTDVVDQNHLKENVEVESSTDVVDQNHLKDNVDVESSTDVVDQNHLKDNVEVESSTDVVDNKPTAALEVSATGHNVDHPIVLHSVEKMGPQKIQDDPSHQEKTTSEVSHNDLKDNIEADSSTDLVINNPVDNKVINHPVDNVVINNPIDNLKENVAESQSEKQLFVVEKDGIYVNMDLLQEKFDASAIDDEAGSDSEKSFKLNILEREEILVNQENVQRNGDDQLTTEIRSFDKAVEPSNILTDENRDIDDASESTKDNVDVKDEGGNEEYELAETVVLVDIPTISKVYRENLIRKSTFGDETKEGASAENQEPTIATEILECDSTIVGKQNSSHDDLDKKESKFVDLQTVIAPLKSLKYISVDDHANVEVTHMKTDSDELFKRDEHIEDAETKLEIVEDQLYENEKADYTSDSKDVSSKENDFDENETKQKHDEDQPTENDMTHTNRKSDDILGQRPVIADKSEKVDDQVNKNEGTPAIFDSEEILKTEKDIKEILKTEKDIDEVKIRREHVDHVDERLDSGRALDDEINTGATTEFVTKTEKQLDGIDQRDRIEPEAEKKDAVMVDELEQQNSINEFQVIDLSKKDDEIVNTENDEEKFGRLFEGKDNEELVKAATIIQKLFRGYIVRSSAQINSSNGQLKLSAALIIQKYVRGYLVRRSMQKTSKFNIQIRDDETERNIKEDISNGEVVAQLPAYSNRFLIPKDSFLERESFADDEDYARTCKELAATSIQKTYRGYRVRRSLKASGETGETEAEDFRNEGAAGDGAEVESIGGNDQVESIVIEAEQAISSILSVATEVLPLETYDTDSFEDEATEDTNVEFEAPAKSFNEQKSSTEWTLEQDSVLGQIVQDNVHAEGQMQQKYNRMSFRDTTINPIQEMSDSSENPETPRQTSTQNAAKVATLDSESFDSKCDGAKSFSYEQLSSDLSDTDDNKRESMKESEMDETSRDERDDLSEVENFDLSSCGEDSLEAMYYSIRKNEILLDRMQKQVHDAGSDDVEGVASENLRIEFPERVTENLNGAMQQVFKSLESSSDCDVGKKDEDEDSSTLDLALDDSSSINDEKEIETSRHIKRSDEIHLEDNVQSESTIDTHETDDENVSQSSELNLVRDGEISNAEQSQQSDDGSLNSSTRFIMKSQSVSEDMMNPIMFAMKRKQALLDQLHVRNYPLLENLSEDHDAFPEHLLSDIDIGNIQRKIFASSVSETDSDYIEQNTTSQRLVRDISTAFDHLSTDSDSTIVSAATKIQAGARGFLTRRRLRRSSAGGTSISFEKRYSFGNAAIDKSLEELIKRQEQINLDGAALKIQQQYRRYQARKQNLKKVSPIREQTLELSGESSVEGMDDNIGITEITLAQKKVDNNQQNEEEIKVTHPNSMNIDEVDTVQLPVNRTPVTQRRLTLQRGDAVQRNSRPDSQDLNLKGGNPTSTNNQSNAKFKDSETGEYTGTINNKQEKKVTAYINIQSLINRGIGPRQRSMPVQIDSELMRIIPKHLRKRVKSADIAKKRSN